MKVVILAGGKGRRICSESTNIPKPLVEIGGIPIICHVMHYFEKYGYCDFVIALGYQAEKVIKAIEQYMKIQTSRKLLTAAGSRTVILRSKENKWTVTLVETGSETATGGRIKRLESVLAGESFLLAWCDGLSDIQLDEMVTFHKHHGRLVTVAAVHPYSRFGILELEGDRVAGFQEKPRLNEQWINSGYFIVDPDAMQYIAGDNDQWECSPVEKLIQNQQFMAWRHEGNWLCMDTIHDWEVLEKLWASGSAFWKSEK